jgi:hypothetical protein
VPASSVKRSVSISKSRVMRLNSSLVMRFISGMNFFAVGLVRALLPVLRHRHARIRCCAIKALHACLVVPDYVKQKLRDQKRLWIYLDLKKKMCCR